MKRLHEADADEVLRRQTLNEVREYINDPMQKQRIERARTAVTRFLKVLEGREPATYAHARRKIVELGCGAADISGYFSWGHDVELWEINPNSVAYLAKSYPWVKLHAEDFTKAEAIPCDLLILCECLEHLPEPSAVCAKWLPLANYALISSPLNGDLRGDLSAGEHVWSFDDRDFQGFVEAGNHVIVDREILVQGQYQILLLLTRKGESSGAGQS